MVRAEPGGGRRQRRRRRRAVVAVGGGGRVVVSLPEQEPEREEERGDHENPTDQDEGTSRGGPTPPRRWRSRPPSSSPGYVGACRPRSRPAGCRGRRPGQREHLTDDCGWRRAPPSPATQGEAALVIPITAASIKPRITTAATGSRPQPGRAALLDHALSAVFRSSPTLDDTRPSSPSPPASADQRNGNGLPASAGTTCAVTQTGVVP